MRFSAGTTASRQQLRAIKPMTLTIVTGMAGSEIGSYQSQFPLNDMRSFIHRLSRGVMDEAPVSDSRASL